MWKPWGAFLDTLSTGQRVAVAFAVGFPPALGLLLLLGESLREALSFAIVAATAGAVADQYARARRDRPHGR
jgi:hypothetical protein